MAWDVIPQSYSDVTKAAKTLGMPEQKEKDLVKLWQYLKANHPELPEPIALGSGGDATKSKSKVKVMRILSQNKDYGPTKKGAPK